jgi:hypothetical protein
MVVAEGEAENLYKRVGNLEKVKFSFLNEKAPLL